MGTIVPLYRKTHRGDPDPSARPFARDGRRQLYFSQRCALNAIEAFARHFAGAPLALREYAVPVPGTSSYSRALVPQ